MRVRLFPLLVRVCHFLSVVVCSSVCCSWRPVYLSVAGEGLSASLLFVRVCLSLSVVGEGLSVSFRCW